MSPDSRVLATDADGTTPSRKQKSSENHTVHMTTNSIPNNAMTASTASTAAPTTASGARRYRASRACQYCRTRKVRCDVLRTEADCTDCRLDNRECILLESRRGKPDQWRNYGQESVRRGPAKPHAQPVSQSPVPRSSTAEADRRDSIVVGEEDPPPGRANDSRTRVKGTPITNDGPGGDVPMSVTFEGNDAEEDGKHDEETDEGDDPGRPGDGIDGGGEADTHSASAYTPSELLDALAFVFRDTSTAVASGSVSAPASHAAATPSNNTTANIHSPGMLPPYAPPPPLPSFIMPLRNKIPADDRAFLARKGALTVPEFDLRIAILQGYIFSVHPFMPMLDLKPFVQAVLVSDDGHSPVPVPADRRISLLLFQAVMFAGLSSLEPHYLHRLGFATAKQAREVFFVRVKLLYKLDVEPDSAAVFQALLLMSSWYSKWNSWKDTSHWTAQALLVAQNMGLHREPTAARDRAEAAPAHVMEPGEYDVRMLSVDDFAEDSKETNDRDGYDDNDDNYKNNSTFDNLGLLLSSADSQGTARLCVEQARLCVLIARVLSTQYTILSTQPPVSHNTMVVPRWPRQQGHERDRDRDEVQQCDTAIAEWHASQQQHPPASSPCIDFHWGMLNLAHLTLVNVLHRTQAMPPSPGGRAAQAVDETPEERAVRKASCAKVKDAACKRDQVRFLGLNGITAMLVACLSHMVDIRGASVSAGGAEDNDDVRDASIFRFSQNMQVLYAMTSMYATADAAVTFLASVVKKVHLPIPTAATPTITTTPTAPVQSLPQQTMVIPPPPARKPTAAHRSMSMSAVPTQPRPVVTGGGTGAAFGFGNTPWTPSQQLAGLGDVTAGWENSMAAGKQFSSTMQAQPRLPASSGTAHLSGAGPACYNTAMKDVDALPNTAARGSTSSSFASYNDIVFDSLSPSAASELDPIMYNYDFFLDNFDLPDYQPQGME
ncbi:hypothetical protein SCUCBS95973_007445 [Sporothrix curviconia]|uniref:Zn(2)-C6 fungal-type domain-containing protein n=1 Tax=Sporothrix curviconia TaxID=1260050 RepID=A0ABP0CE05_9PEZI